MIPGVPASAGASGGRPAIGVFHGKIFSENGKKVLTFSRSYGIINHAVENSDSLGGVAQLGERLNGIQEVIGSIPTVSTKEKDLRKQVFFFGGGYALCLRQRAPPALCAGGLFNVEETPDGFPPQLFPFR